MEVSCKLLPDVTIELESVVFVLVYKSCVPSPNDEHFKANNIFLHTKNAIKSTVMSKSNVDSLTVTEHNTKDVRKH